MESLGQKIRQRRQEKGLTQSQLAEGLVSASAISQIEADKINPSYKLLCQIAERLEVPLDFFLTETGEYLEHSTSHKLAKTLILAKEYANAVPILENLLATGGGDELDLLMDLSTCLLQLDNLSTVKELLEKVTTMSLKADDHRAHVWALHRLGLVYYKQHNLSLAMHYWQRAYDSLHEMDVDDSFLKAEITTNLAVTYNRLGHYDQSTDLFLNSQDLLKNSSNLYHLATNYLGLGRSHYGKKEYKQAQEYWQEAMTLFKSLDHIQYSIMVKENFAILRGELGEHEAALEILQECTRQYVELGLEQLLSNNHAEIAKILIRLGRDEAASEHLDQALALCQPHSKYHAQCYNVSSLLYAFRHEYEAAIEAALQSAELFRELEMVHDYHRMRLHVSDLFKKLGDYKSSTEILEETQHYIQNYFRDKGILL
ncbi:tetratricopeptide repeat protein [Tumebacillus sp. BK434]|uniref:helix-turn-helix domain-containing protein n=1 Tax=Tumebacillus sp. BK434 TaxID=2512169 RepID=UPI00104507C5|nr:helix-turn-helix transcriptional regulator [Tumebacillus sp. BK434]TCP52887.1 tetratricopeptide repeat protein [Tumebacillus sp. BK434]